MRTGSPVPNARRCRSHTYSRYVARSRALAAVGRHDDRAVVAHECRGPPVERRRDVVRQLGAAEGGVRGHAHRSTEHRRVVVRRGHLVEHGRQRGGRHRVRVHDGLGTGRRVRGEVQRQLTRRGERRLDRAPVEPVHTDELGRHVVVVEPAGGHGNLLAHPHGHVARRPDDQARAAQGATGLDDLPPRVLEQHLTRPGRGAGHRAAATACGRSSRRPRGARPGRPRDPA